VMFADVLITNGTAVLVSEIVNVTSINLVTTAYDIVLGVTTSNTQFASVRHTKIIPTTFNVQ